MKTYFSLFTIATTTTSPQTNGNDWILLIASLAGLLLCYGAYRFVRNLQMALRIDLEGLHLEDI